MIRISSHVAYECSDFTVFIDVSIDPAYCLCIFFMLPKLVLVTQCNSWKIHLLHIVEFHIDTLFELQEVRDSVGGIVEKYTRGCQHNNTPDYPV